MRIKKLIEETTHNIEQRRSRENEIVAWLTEHQEELEKLTLTPEVLDYSGIDFNFPSHEDAIKIMQVVNAGSWEKRYNESTITYTTKIGSVNFRIYNGQPPPNCKIVEEEVTIPSHYEPETKAIRRRIVCQQEATDAIEA